jgi:glutamyl-tRNA reductase
MQRLVVLGLNHTTAPLELREKLAFAPEQRAAALEALRAKFTGCEAVLLSTCNRVELYVARAVHGNPRPAEMAEFLAAYRGVPIAALQPHLYDKAERGAVEHLFSVASSIDSMVVGETQILGQVRDAYDEARALGAAGSSLNPLFQRALAVGKQVMTETAINEGRVSVGSVAVDCASHIFGRYNDKTVLCIGAGKMAALVLQSFSSLKPRRVLICNRSHEKAIALGERFGVAPVLFENLNDHLIAADVVVTSAGAQHAIITREQFEPLLKARRYRPIFLIDIALPRNVDPAVAELENVYLYNLDDLQKLVAATHSRRSESIEQAKTIIRKQVDEFLAWNRTRALGPMIDQLYQRHHQIAREEVDRVLSKMPHATEAERAAIEDLARRLVNKFLHDPITRLRASDPEHTGSVSPYLHALEKLFALESGQTSIEQPPPPADTSDEQDEA